MDGERAVPCLQDAAAPVLQDSFRGALSDAAVLLAQPGKFCGCEQCGRANESICAFLAGNKCTQ